MTSLEPPAPPAQSPLPVSQPQLPTPPLLPTPSPAAPPLSRLRALLHAWVAAEDGGGVGLAARSPAQLECERWLLRTPGRGPRFSRWMAVPAAVSVQAVLGSFYSTSVFNKWADAHAWGGAPGANAGGFTACVAFYGLGTIVFGHWVGRHGVFAAVRRALVLMPLGWALLSLSTGAGGAAGRAGLVLGYGLAHGLGCAHAYVSTTACLQAWFPEMKGFVSGLAVCGAGVGSYVWTMVARALLAPPLALDPPHVQAVFALVFFVIVGLSLPVLRNAPPGWKGPAAAEAAAAASATATAEAATTAAAATTATAATAATATADTDGLAGNSTELAATAAAAAATTTTAAAITASKTVGSAGTALQASGSSSKLALTAAAAAVTATAATSVAAATSQLSLLALGVLGALPGGARAVRWLAAASSPPFTLAPDEAYTFASAAVDLDFRLMCMLVFGQFIAGAVFLSSAADMAQNLFGTDASFAALVTSWLNLVNFVSRFAWGFATDLIGRKAFFVLSAALQLLALALMAAVAIPRLDFALWLCCFLLIGSLYGGGFGVLPAALSDLFGPRLSAATHGTMLGIWALSVVVGVPTFGAVTSALSAVPPHGGGAAPVPTAKAYIVNAAWLALGPAGALIAALLLTVRREDRRLRKRRLGGAPVRCPCGRLLWLWPRGSGGVNSMSSPEVPSPSPQQPQQLQVLQLLTTWRLLSPDEQRVEYALAEVDSDDAKGVGGVAKDAAPPAADLTNGAGADAVIEAWGATGRAALPVALR
jgi:hypothetical protein